MIKSEKEYDCVFFFLCSSFRYENCCELPELITVFKKHIQGYKYFTLCVLLEIKIVTFEITFKKKDMWVNLNYQRSRKIKLRYVLVEIR